jgi:hypothetical protein
MKKLISLVLAAVLIAALSACASRSEAPVMNEKMAAAQVPPASSSAARRTYVNQELGFSFQIPDSWESENYNTVVDGSSEKKAKLKESVSQGGTVNFLFQGDPENPLLTVQVLPKSQWDAADKSSDPSAPVFLGESGALVYCFTMPQNSTYEVGAQADLYNSMVLTREDVPTRFKILTGGSKASSAVPAPDTK